MFIVQPPYYLQACTENLLNMHGMCCQTNPLRTKSHVLSRMVSVGLFCDNGLVLGRLEVCREDSADKLATSSLKDQPMEGVPPNAPSEATGSVFGAMALITGTSVGAGILALPATTAPSVSHTLRFID